ITVNPLMAGALLSCSAVLALVLYRLAKRGSARHQNFAAKAAAVDGELVDVIGNMALVRAFGMTFREQKRFGATVKAELGGPEEKSAVSGAAASAARGDPRAAGGGAARLGLVALGSRPRNLRRYRAGQLARLHDPARHARPRGGTGRRHAARGEIGGSGQDT